MSEQSAEIDWGNWVLGDAPHVLQLACASVGHATEVVHAAVSLPRSEHGLALPEVSLVLADASTVERVRETLLGDGYALAPDSLERCDELTGPRWRAILPGFDLLVEAAGEDPQ